MVHLEYTPGTIPTGGSAPPLSVAAPVKTTIAGTATKVANKNVDRNHIVIRNASASETAWLAYTNDLTTDAGLKPGPYRLEPGRTLIIKGSDWTGELWAIRGASALDLVSQEVSGKA
jgi:hypothetical protein